MPTPFPRRPFRLPLLCVALSAGLWIWSTHLPETAWESSNAPASPEKSTVSPVAVPEDTEPTAAVETPAPQTTAPFPNPTPVESIIPLASNHTPDSTSAAPPVPPSPVPSTTPQPTDAELAGPLPQRSPEEQPAPAPASATTTATAPLPLLDLSDVARQPELWPRQVVLLVSVRFPVIMKGVNVGNVQVPPGRPVLVRRVNPDGTLEVELPESQGSKAKIKAQGTDLMARARAMAAAKEKTAPQP